MRAHNSMQDKIMKVPAEYKTQYAWPADGGLRYGIIEYKSGHQIFFEGVFNDTLIHGEGRTLIDAEKKAWEQYKEGA